MTDADRRAGTSDRYGLVLLLLLGSFLLSAFLPSDRLQILPLLLYLTALIRALRNGRPSWLSRRWLPWTLAAVSVLGGAAAGMIPNRVVRGTVSLWAAAILALTIVVVVRRILAHRVVTLQTVFGALSAYLLIGFLYAALLYAVARLQTAPFFTADRPVDNSTIQYFSFVTMTTVGYGDLTPAGEPGRSLAVLDALTGQVFLVTLVARLVSTFGGNQSR